MLKINAYIGQMVQFMPNPDDAVGRSNNNTGYIPAIITRVHSPTMVNLKIIPDHGPVQDRGSVSHKSNNPNGYHFIFVDSPLEIINSSDALLVSFGNYLLSDERKRKVSEENFNLVTHADLENWKASMGYIN